MKLMCAIAVAGLALAVTSLLPSTALASDYEPTPLSRALAGHDLVLTGSVTARADGKATVEPVRMIKGKAPSERLVLPDVWRPGTEIGYGPVSLEKGKTYLLMLRRDKRGGYTLSTDFAAEAVAVVSSSHDPLVRAATVLQALSQQDQTDSRKQTLAAAWEKESDETKLKLLHDFAAQPADAATVPFLVNAMNVDVERSSLMEWSAIVIQKHKYKEAVPGLLKVLERKDWGCLYPARTLGVLKVREAYEPIMALIEKSPVGNEAYLIEALCDLEDKRAIPFLIKTIHRGLPGLDPERDKIRSWSVQENEYAISGLARLRAPEAVDPLMRLLDLENGYQDLRLRAIEALSEIGAAALRAIPKISELAQTSRIPNDAAQKAIQKIETASRTPSSKNGRKCP